MQLEEYLLPVDTASSRYAFINKEDDCLGKHILCGFQAEQALENGTAQMALIGVAETRGALEYYENSDGPDRFRECFYALKKPMQACQIIDLGNLKQGITKEDTYFGLAAILEELIIKKVIPVIIGGSQDLTFAHYMAYKNLKQVFNLAAIDSRFDLGLPDETISSRSFIGKMVMEKPNYLFNFSCIGYQTYYVGQQAVELMSKLFFETYRLGVFKADLTELEPIIRNADILSFDLSSIRHSDSPASSFSSPNGLNGEEACQAMFYAGMSDKMAGLGLYEYNPSREVEGQSASLMAQMIWYFVEGLANRKNDIPSADNISFITYRVSVSGNDLELVFLKSKKSDRWWIEFPMPEGRDFFSKKLYIPCSYRDYEVACNNELPERWWQTLQKIS